jgi:tRNA nucleotidyltransferase (CCA-adding enzyme)
LQAVVTHRNTDFDALASVVAATLIYPDAIPLIPRNINPNVKAFLSIHKDIFETVSADTIDATRIRHLIVVDTNKWSRIENSRDFKKNEDLDIVLWDHHEDTGDIRAQQAVQESCGANITLMIRELKKRRTHISPIQATLFLAGLYEDTGQMMFPSTTAEDAAAASYLLENKADLGILGRFLRPAYGEKQKEILFEMVKNASRRRINGYSVSINALNLEEHVEGLAIVVRMYREIVNVDAAFGIFSNPAKKRHIVIGRSNSEDINIGAIMQGLGGGGHPGAGSAMVRNAEPGIIREMIEEMIRHGRGGSVQISDLMSFPVHQVPADMPMREVAVALRQKGCTGLPVVENDTLVGIISRRDFRKLNKERQLDAPVKAFMSTRVMTIEPGKSPMQAARLMVKHDIGRLPVVEDGKMIGILTRSDTMLYFYDLLPD